MSKCYNCHKLLALQSRAKFFCGSQDQLITCNNILCESCAKHFTHLYPYLKFLEVTREEIMVVEIMQD
jgi:hypothetical protein